MANNNNTSKEQERAELHRAIWQIANDLRGSVDGWDFKQYVLRDGVTRWGQVLNYYYTYNY